MEAHGSTDSVCSAGSAEFLDRDSNFCDIMTELGLGEGTQQVEIPQASQAVQTDLGAVDSTVNTDPDWEEKMAILLAQSKEMAAQHDELMAKQCGDGRRSQIEQLQKKKLEATRENQALVEKLHSVKVKLQLNNSKSTRKNFLTKKQEMNSEKIQKEEERNRLTHELEEKKGKLELLLEEQREEQRRRREELKLLSEEAERLKKEAQEAELQALKDEVVAVEMKRDAAMSCIESWRKELRDYLINLRVDFPQQYQQEKLSWDKKEAAVRKNMAELQSRYRDVLRLLQEGRGLESLPRINMPQLPQIPTADLIFNQLTNSIVDPVQVPQPIRPHIHPFFINPAIRFHQPPHHQNLPQFQPPFQPPFPRHNFPPPQFPPTAGIPPLHPLESRNRATPSPTHTPSPPTVPTNQASAAPSQPTSSAAGSLEKILEKLGARFPQCNRTQLTSLLKQVKESRTTLSGLSIDEVVEECCKFDQKDGFLATIDRSSGAVGPIQRPPSADGHQGAAARKLCLMCQNFVDSESRYPLSCSHTVHRDCIRTWLQSSKNNPCPFCPAK